MLDVCTYVAAVGEISISTICMPTAWVVRALIHLDALQVAAQALNGSEAEACIQDAPTEALSQWLWDLECEHAPKLYHTAERFFSCTGGAMHPLLEPWMPRSKPGRSHCFVAVHQLLTSSSKHDF